LLHEDGLKFFVDLWIKVLSPTDNWTEKRRPKKESRREKAFVAVKFGRPSLGMLFSHSDDVDPPTAKSQKDAHGCSSAV